MPNEPLALLEAWRARRDERAFEDLVLPELGRALALARATGCTREEAEDALQESLSRLAADRGDGPVRVGPRVWLLRAVRDAARSGLRSARRRRAREKVAAATEGVPSSETATALGEEVERALALLSPEDREVVRLRYLLDLDYGEVAGILGTSEGACRMRVHRAVGRLQATLGAGAVAMLAAVPLPRLAHPATLVKAAMATAPAVPAAAASTGGVLLMTFAQKSVFAAVAVLCAGFGAILGSGLSTGRVPVPAQGPEATPAGVLAARVATLEKERDAAIAERDRLAEALAGKEAAAGMTTKPTAPEFPSAPAKPRPPVSPYLFTDLTRKAGELSGAWTADILQVQDAGKRDAAIALMAEALRSGDPVRVLAALMTINGTSEVAYDRAALRGSIVAALDREEPEIRLAAMTSLFLAAPQPGDVDRLLSLREDPSPQVRLALPFALTRLTKGAVEGEVAAVVMQGLEEASGNAGDLKNVLARIWWGKVSPEVEERLLALAHSEDRDVRYQTVYFALSRIQEKTPGIVDEMIRLLDDPDSNVSIQALWGLTHGIPEAVAPRVAPVLVKLIQSRRPDSGTWDSCFFGLQTFGTEAEIPALEALAGNELVPERFRKTAAEVVARIRERAGR